MSIRDARNKRAKPETLQTSLEPDNDKPSHKELLESGNWKRINSILKTNEHLALKMQCLAKGIDMSDYIREAILGKLEGDGVEIK